jgi:hypothetical protein
VVVNQENPMSIESRGIPGIVKDGVVVPQSENALPDGAHVEIFLQTGDIPPELAAELDAWEKAGDEAWAMIDQWEEENQ